MEVNWHQYKRETPKGHTVPAKLHYNGKTYTDQHDIVNQFNEYFINWSKLGIYNSLEYKT